MATLTYHGHSTFILDTDDGTRLVFDPWFDENPRCGIGVDDIDRADYILVTHGHFDHYADCLPLARKTGATVISTFEIVGHLAGRGYGDGHGMNTGGAYDFPFGRVKLTVAHHTGSIHEGTDGLFYAAPVGFLVTLRDGPRIYHAGDTALTLDMKLLEGEVDVALLPIGDNFTMGPDDAARAVELIRPEVAVPMHYGTFPAIERDPEDFRRAVGDRARVEIPAPGDSLEVGAGAAT